MNTKERVLVLSYSPIRRDPRVLRQINWLTERPNMETHVSAYGLEEFPDFPHGDYTALRPPVLLTRFLIYFFASHARRQSLSLKTFLKSNELEKIQNGHYKAIILNDLDFVGVDALFEAAELAGTRVFIDLHEFFYDVGGSFIFRILNQRYYHWLLQKLNTRTVASFFTVSDAIANLYERNLSRRPVSILNVPEARQQESGTPRDPELEDEIRLVYHGAAGKSRGILRLIRAMRHVGPRFELNLMLMASKMELIKLTLYVLLFGVRKRTVFHPPVPFSEITKTLQRFDVEIIFYHPPHSTNEKLSLPNKFFEASMAGLAVITGDSTSIRELVERYDSGWICEGWGVLDLAKTISSVLPTELEKKKINSQVLAKEISAESQKSKFLKAIEVTSWRSNKS